MIHALLDFLRTLTTPDRLIHLLSTVLSGWLGYATLTAIVFAETGLLVGFVLPGDSLFFTIGVVAGAGQLNLTVIIVLLIAACLAGDWCGYLLGRRTGPAIFSRPDSRFFKQEHLQRTNAFYARHGGKTIIYAKFVPVIRTFAPFVAGVAMMRYRSFIHDRARRPAGKSSHGAAQFREVCPAGDFRFPSAGDPARGTGHETAQASATAG
jgi:membrane-associated protein